MANLHPRAVHFAVCTFLCYYTRELYCHPMSDTHMQSNQGRYTESAFAHQAERRQWNIRTSTWKENVYHHIDYFLTKNAHTHAIDVKGMRALSRSNPVVQDVWHVVEFIAVVSPSSPPSSFSLPFDILTPDFHRGSGRAGWVYGNADFIAFETRDHWLFVRPADLLQFCASTVDCASLASSARTAQYSLYSRPNRGDLISLIHLNDLSSLAHYYWRK